MRRGFITLGTWCLDRNIVLDFWPNEDMAAQAHHITLAGGGSACNFALNIKKLDPEMHVETQGLIGDGEKADFLMSIADTFGIKRSGLIRSDLGDTQTTDAFVSQETNRRTHILYSGVADFLTPEHFDFANTTAKIAHFGLPSLHKTMDQPWRGEKNGWIASLKEAEKHGLHTNLELVAGNEAKLQEIVVPCLPHLSSLVVNDHEIGAITGIQTQSNDTTNIDQIKFAANSALKNGRMDFVLVHFPEGAILVTRDGQEITQPSVDIPIQSIKGTNGAGDAFSAGFFYGFHENWPLLDAIKLGHATAAASMRSVETYTSVQSVSKCLDLANKWAWRSAISNTSLKG
jgi:sugar/nucleoside kinase (ribokinase family)